MKKLQGLWRWFKADKKRLFGALALLVVVFLISSHFLGKKEEMSFQTARVEKGTIVSSVSASGQILPANILNITTGATGVVKDVYVKNGDFVSAGQRIAEITLDTNAASANAKAYASLVSAQNALNAAKNNYRLTQASLEKVYDDLKGHEADETFTQKETRTKAEVANDNAYDTVKTAEANLVSAAAAYRLASPIIAAPYSGIVDNVTLTAGLVFTSESTSAIHTRVAVITFEGSPLASFNVSEVDVNRVFPGQKVNITLDSIADKEFEGEVLTVDKIGTVSSGVTNYPVIVSVKSDAPEILPNMAATAEVILETKEDVLIIPSGAVETRGEKSVVGILKDGEIKMVPVEIGLTNDTQTEIISGVSEGDEVVVGGGNALPGTSPFSTFRFGGGGGSSGGVMIQH